MRFDLVDVGLWSDWDVRANIDVNIYEAVSKCVQSGLDFQVLFIREFKPFAFLRHHFYVIVL